MTFFTDRADAAEKLIGALPEIVNSDWLVLALPRGGVPIAEAIARHLGSQLDLIVVRKVGAPGNPELAIAAVTGPDEKDIVLNAPLADRLGLSEAEIRARAAEQVREVAERRRKWNVGDTQVPLTGRDVLIVDDGVATGTTLAAAVQSAEQKGARRIAIAVPVALGSALRRFRQAGLLIVCPHPNAAISAVGAAYRRFPQVEDDEVAQAMARNRH